MSLNRRAGLLRLFLVTFPELPRVMYVKLWKSVFMAEADRVERTFVPFVPERRPVKWRESS